MSDLECLLARGGGGVERFSVNNMKFPTHFAESKVNPSTTKSSVVSEKGRVEETR